MNNVQKNTSLPPALLDAGIVYLVLQMFKQTPTPARDVNVINGGGAIVNEVDGSRLDPA